MKYPVAVMYIQSFIRTGLPIQLFMGKEYTDTQIRKRSHKPTFILFKIIAKI
jgi:hypothetical protein